MKLLILGLVHVGDYIVVLFHVNFVLRSIHGTVLVDNLPHEAPYLVKVAHVVVVPYALGTVDDLHWVAARLMLLQVPIQVGLLPETAVAQWTLERLLFVVDIPHMALQVGGDGEAALAVFALVGLLARVGS